MNIKLKAKIAHPKIVPRERSETDSNETLRLDKVSVTYTVRF
jgi:hypothetical protein